MLIVHLLVFLFTGDEKGRSIDDYANITVVALSRIIRRLMLSSHVYSYLLCHPPQRDPLRIEEVPSRPVVVYCNVAALWVFPGLFRKMCFPYEAVRYFIHAMSGVGVKLEARVLFFWRESLS